MYVVNIVNLLSTPPSGQNTNVYKSNRILAHKTKPDVQSEKRWQNDDKTEKTVSHNSFTELFLLNCHKTFETTKKRINSH